MRLHLKAYPFLLLIGFTFFSLKGTAQIQGKIEETFTRSPIPFVHISINDGQAHFLSDIDGYFSIPLDSSVKKVSFQAHLHRSVVLYPDSLPPDYLWSITMNKHLLFAPERCSSPEGHEIMKKVMAHKKTNEIKHLKYVSYSTYNKTTLTPAGVDKTNSTLEKVFKFFSLKFTTFKVGQHFLIVESVTKKDIYNKRNQKEIIEGAKSTILNVPSLFVQTTQIHAFSPYEDFINIGGKAYVSPLAKHTSTRYAFSVIDSIQDTHDTIYVLKYNPLGKKAFDGLKGLLYINSKNYAVQHYTAGPAKEKKLQMYGAQSFIYYPEERRWFPSRSKTLVTIERSGEYFLATLNTYITNVNLHSFLNKKNFDEVILEYPDYAPQQDTSFWNSKRATPLTPYDSNTYIYYDSADQKKFIQRSLQFGEHLYYGNLSYKMVDLELRKFIDANQHEGVRIGIGGHTNEHFSERFTVGAYVGYGFKDTHVKFGGDLAYKLRKYPVSFKTSIIHDVREAGGYHYPFNRFQYSTETLRRFRINVMDIVTEWENSAEIHPLKYLDLRPAIALSKVVAAYDYQFESEPDKIFHFVELKAGLRYAFGEQIIQLPNRKISIGSKYPVFYFQYIKGLSNFLQGEYNYNKLNVRIDYTLNALDLGKTGIQVNAGLVNGSVPYSKLYNGNGSLRHISVVVHNTFETMRYNEFLSDRYFSVFMSHNFGRIPLNSEHIRPSILVLHNIGYGSLKNPEAHKQIPFKTMEKGYYESGMLIDNIVIFNLTGLKVGLGAGFFLRYGYYANPQSKDNFVFKFVTNFGL